MSRALSLAGFQVTLIGRIWVTPEEHIREDAQYFGDSLIVEHRFVYDLLLALREHGLRAVCR
jgi:hypothetical protein